VVICLERGADLHTAQLMPLPLTVSCFSKIQIGFTFLVPAHQGSPGQRVVKRVCVNPEKNWHQHLTHLFTSPVKCSHFTLGNPKSFINSIIHTYFRLFTLSWKKRNSNCCTSALAVYLLFFSASYYLQSPITTSGVRYRSRILSTPVCDTGTIWTTWGSRHGLNFSRWCTTRLLSGEKD